MKYIIILFEILVVLIALFFINRLITLNGDYSKTSKNRFDMMLVLDQIRHSSDDLTKFARAYAVTGDKKFKKKYFETSDIRNGKVERPLYYENIYWDLNEKIRELRHPLAKKKSLKDMALDLPFTRVELSKIFNSQNSSNGLVHLEVEAFRLVENDKKNIGIDLLYSKNYYEAKHKIMNPIDELMIVTSNRMLKEIDEISKSLNIYYAYFFILTLIYLIGNYFAIKYKRKCLNDEIAFKTYALEEINEHLEKKVVEEVEKTTQKHEQMLYQSRLAQLGEMISMIAHQWRQPLGAISASTIDLKMKIELEIFDLDSSKGKEETLRYFLKSLESIDGFIDNLTTTINDFRDFYKVNKLKKLVQIDEPVQKALAIIKTSLKTNDIEIVEEYNSIKEIELFDGEVMQVILNIFKNSEDNFKLQNIDKPKIKIETRDTDSGILITICDNGGGIADNIISKIFDPYFSTKYKKNGTGLGLYMSRLIINDHHNGSLQAFNIKDGVCFEIELNDLKFNVKNTI